MTSTTAASARATVARKYCVASSARARACRPARRGAPDSSAEHPGLGDRDGGRARRDQRPARAPARRRPAGRGATRSAKSTPPIATAWPVRARPRRRTSTKPATSHGETERPRQQQKIGVPTEPTSRNQRAWPNAGEQDDQVDEVAAGQGVGQAARTTPPAGRCPRRSGANMSAAEASGAGDRGAPRASGHAASALQLQPMAMQANTATWTTLSPQKSRPRPGGDSRNLSRASSPSQPSRIEWVRKSSAPASCSSGAAEQEERRARAARSPG